MDGDSRLIEMVTCLLNTDELVMECPCDCDDTLSKVLRVRDKTSMFIA